MKSATIRTDSGLNLDTIEQKEVLENRLARGLNFYKLFWVFMSGSFLGVVLETVWCLVTKFEFQVRSGLVYGPFNLIYGFGALFMTLGLYWLREKNVLLLCLVGALIGSALEYASSWIQEELFSSESWDYSGMYFNLHGRINLLYSIFWGILSAVWIRKILPVLFLGIMKIPNALMKPLTWFVLAYMTVNIFVSGIAVTRWIRRDSGVPAERQIWHVMDERFPDERMEALYPNLKFIHDE